MKEIYLNRINNKQNYISNHQIIEFISMISADEYFPRHISIYETRLQLLIYCISHIFDLRSLSFILLFCAIGGIDQYYNPFYDTALIFGFTQKCEIKSEKQYRLLRSLMIVLRTRHYYPDIVKIKDVDIMDVFLLNEITYVRETIKKRNYDILIDNYVTKVMNDNADRIADKMGWDCIWEIEVDEEH